MTKDTLFVANDPRYHSGTKATVIGIKYGETGFYPIFTPATPDELNDGPVDEKIVSAAITASMWGWHRNELTAPAIDWFDERMGDGKVMVTLRVPKDVAEKIKADPDGFYEFIAEEAARMEPPGEQAKFDDGTHPKQQASPAEQAIGDTERNCKHEWNQTPAEADENGGRIYCLKCGQDGDA